MSGSAANVLSMRGIGKRFPGVVALDDVDFDVRAGEVHALMGANGAGKSTLIKILAGAYTPDAGDIAIEGRVVAIPDPHVAQQLGISPVHQELNLALPLSVAENIFLGRQPQRRTGLIDNARMHKDAAALLDELGVHIEPTAAVEHLSLAHRQMVSIARAVSADARIVILDEPTAPLSEHEASILFDIIRRLRDRGLGIVYISHRLEEVFELADRVTVLRDGRLVGTAPVGEVTLARLIAMMVGRELDALSPAERAGSTPAHAAALQVRGLSRRGVLRDCSLMVRRGEIVGLFGLVGAGRTELARAIFGADPIDSGDIWVDGQRRQIRSPRDAIKCGIGLAPEDRKFEGLLTDASVRRNIALAALPRLALRGLVRGGEERRLAERFVQRLAIKTPSVEQPVKFLSGGNQQRVVVAKWLATNPRLLILDEPTKGIDVHAKTEIHSLIVELASQGVGVLLISSELPEVMAMSDRIVVMHRGRMMGSFGRGESDREGLMRAATGEANDGAVAV
jgi:ribose transport system ATP-binding protein